MVRSFLLLMLSTLLFVSCVESSCQCATAEDASDVEQREVQSETPLPGVQTNVEAKQKVEKR